VTKKEETTLFLVRHAEAEDRRPGLADAERALTREGRKTAERMAGELRALGVRLDLLLSSPWHRARQTADRFEGLVVGERRDLDALAQPPDEELLTMIPPGSVALVGHQPWMAQLADWLLTGRADGGWIRFRKGSVAWLSGEPRPGRMRLERLLQPD
jgi:phosphohistidine phosphatase